MKLTYPHYLASQSFSKKFVRQYFTTSNIIKGFFIAFLLSAFILFELLGLKVGVISLGFSTLGITILLTQKQEVFFWSGLFIGLFWFYWISFSFIHYGFGYLLPLGLFGVSFIYGVLFWFMAIIHDNAFVKGVMLFLVTSYIHPFGFNWLDLRLLLVNTPLYPNNLSLAIFIMLCATFTCKKWYYKLLFVPLLVSLFFLLPTKKEVSNLPFSFELAQTNIAQGDKWKEELQTLHVKSSLEFIDKAIKANKRAVILPESAFPLYLNRVQNLVEMLKEKSQNIAIIAGALTYEDENFYNSTYFFDKGKMQIFHKVILVPFGEQIPLPKFMRDFINAIFYGGAKDFVTAKEPQDFLIDGVKIRNAICFEATTSKLFEKEPKFMIAISNNAWFMPSTEPILQHLLLKLYANLNNTTIYHSVNGSKSEVIFPKQYYQF